MGLLKTLVVFTSKTGHCRKLAMEIAEALDVDAEEVVDKKLREGPWGLLTGSFDALLGHETEIVELAPHKHPENYGMVVIGTPVWAGRITPAINTYLKRHKGSYRRVAFFVTMGGDDPSKAVQQLRKLAGEPTALLAIKAKELEGEERPGQVTKFIEEIKVAAK